MYLTYKVNHIFRIILTLLHILAIFYYFLLSNMIINSLEILPADLFSKYHKRMVKISQTLAKLLGKHYICGQNQNIP